MTWEKPPALGVAGQVLSSSTDTTFSGSLPRTHRSCVVGPVGLRVGGRARWASEREDSEQRDKCNPLITDGEFPRRRRFGRTRTRVARDSDVPSVRGPLGEEGLDVRR